MGQQYSTNLGLSQLPEIDEKQFGQVYAELLRMRNALKVLQSALDVYTGALGETESSYWDQTPAYAYLRLQNISRVYRKATETISAGRLVNFYNSAGELVARNANATDATKPVRAYAPKEVLSGEFGEFVILGLMPSVGLTPGSLYYLTTTAGAYSATAPAVPGNLKQEIGWAYSDNLMVFNPILNPAVI
jgi:hypothetical protein